MPEGFKSFWENLPTWAQWGGPIFLVLLVIAFAVPSEDEEGSGGDSGPTPAEQAANRKAKQAARKAAALEQCREDIAPLIDELETLGSRLSVGVQFPDYTRYVGNVRVAYDEVLDDAISSLPCIKGPAGQAERALNIYVAAGNEWNDCIQELGCDVDALNLSDKWVKASLLTAQAAGP